MYFLVLATDREGVLDIRKATRPIHREYLRNHQAHNVKVHLGGPTLTPDGKDMNGSLLVVEAASEQDVLDFVANDPYNCASLFSSVVVKPWMWTMGNTVETAK